MRRNRSSFSAALSAFLGVCDSDAYAPRDVSLPRASADVWILVFPPDPWGVASVSVGQRDSSASPLLEFMIVTPFLASILVANGSSIA